MVVEEIKTLILGADGMLGHDLQKVFLDAVSRGRGLDITDEAAISTFIRELNPDLVINAAAYTDVDSCEDNRETAFEVNGKALEYIAKACNNVGATLVHYSTDYIFDGSKEECVESDQPCPINAYGESKLLGEKNIMENMSDYRIIRTSWLFGVHGKNFVETVLRLSGDANTVRVVNDQFGKPTYTADLARKTAEIVGLAPGIYHITNDGVCSWYEFAVAIIDNASPCSSEEFVRKADRPRYSVLVNTKTSKMQHWRDALKEYLNIRGNGEN
jgi:dTDP-4-dehydrorhamnose reductase